MTVTEFKLKKLKYVLLVYRLNLNVNYISVFYMYIMLLSFSLFYLEINKHTEVLCF